jgi:demethylmenaquinone methyltransferase/2-methoxy-6-polyprenyl-1,4-benzoquinol methylase
MTVDKSNERVRAMFGQIAPRYDLLNHLLSLGIDRYWRWRTVRAALPRGTAPLLDLCCGTGDLTLAYARAAKEAQLIVGSDFCHPMLTHAEGKGNRTALRSRLAWLEADSQHLPLPDNTFQIVSVAFGLRNIADTQLGLSEMVRVCQPGGKVVILEFSTPKFPPMRWLYHFYFHQILPRVGQALARNQAAAYNYLPESVGEFPAGAELAKLLEAAGLKSVCFRSLSLGIATLYVGEK